MSTKVRVKDISKRGGEVLCPIGPDVLEPLPPPYDKPENEPAWKELSAATKDSVVCNLDGVVALSLPKPKDEAEEKEHVEKFRAGLKKLLEKNNNWTFLQPLMLSLDYCVNCQSCNDACPVFTASGGKEIYRPTYRAEVLRRLVAKYAKPGGKLFARFTHGDIDLNWTTISRLYELCEVPSLAHT